MSAASGDAFSRKLRDLEPVRVYIHSLLVAVIGVLGVSGALSENWITMSLALGTAILGFPAVEVARSKVTPVTKVSALEDTLSSVRSEVATELGRIGSDLNQAVAQVTSDMGSAVQAAIAQAQAPREPATPLEHAQKQPEANPFL